MNRWIKILGVVMALIVFIALTGNILLLFPVTALTGWIKAPTRILTRWHPSPSSLLLFISTAILIAAGIHRFVAWVYAEITSHIPETIPTVRLWRWPWTFSGLGIMAAVFVAVVSTVLTVHQIYWLAKAHHPWLVSQQQEKFIMHTVKTSLETVATESHWNLAKIKQAFWNADTMVSGVPIWEAADMIVTAKDNQSADAIIIVPKHPLVKSRARIAILQPDIPSQFRPYTDLKLVLNELGIRQQTAEKRINDRDMLP